MAGEIPIQNLYYLLAYAWDHLPEADEVEIAANDCHSLTELFARILAHGAQRLVKRGLDRDYLYHREETAIPRGRMDLVGSFPLLAAKRGRLVCEFEDLSHNTLPNRILKTTIGELLHVPGLKKETVALLHQQYEILRRIEPIRLTSRLFRRVRLHRNNRDYRLLLNICALLHDSRLPTQEDGQVRFRDFFRDPQKMPLLFEAFVRNFYKREQVEYAVGAIQLEWDVVCDEESRAVLPIMRTDVSLQSAQRSIIIDCKFYKEAFTSRYDQEKVHSSHLYQLYAYLRNAERKPGWEASDGLLLYPAVSSGFDHCFNIEGRQIRVVSINLDTDWQEIHRSLLDLLSQKDSICSQALFLRTSRP